MDIDLNSFVDELEKIARLRQLTSLSDDAMRAVINKLDPAMWSLAKASSGAELKSLLRDVLHVDLAVKTPLSTRLKSFKHWKRTGKVPELESTWVEGAGRFPREAWRESRGVVPGGVEAGYARGAEPVTLYSGGTTSGLAEAAKNPRTVFDHSFVIPGKVRAEGHGLYADPRVEVAKAYSGRSRFQEGAPALMEMQVPSKDVLRFTNEVMIPRGAAISNPKITQLPKTAAIDGLGKIAQALMPSQPQKPRMSPTRRSIAKGVAVGTGVLGGLAGARYAPGPLKVPATILGGLGGAGVGLMGSIFALSPGSAGRLNQMYQQRMAARPQ